MPELIKKGKRLYTELKGKLKNLSRADKYYSDIQSLVHCMEENKIFKNNVFEYLELASRLDMQLCVRENRSESFDYAYLELVHKER